MMSDDLSHITEEQWKQVAEEAIRKLGDEARNAPICFRCSWRCDPPFGNGKLCLSCASKPTGEDMRRVINI